MNYEAWHDRLSKTADEFATYWIYGLTVVLVMLTIVVFNALHNAGLMSTQTAEGLRTPLTLVAAVGLGGFALKMLALLSGMVALAKERESE